MSKIKGQLNHSTNKEKAMERKIILLEERLRLVEQFVELRFCESFKDFTIRKMLRDLPPEDDGDHYESSSEDEISSIPSKSKPPPPKTRQQRTSKRTPAPASSSKGTTSATLTNQRELRVRVLQTSGSTSTSPPPPPSSLPLIKNPPPGDSDDDFTSDLDNFNNEPDDNFTNFNPEVEVTQEDNSDSNDPDYLGGTTSTPSSRAKRRNPPAKVPMSSKKKRSTGSGGPRRIPPANKKECPECHTFWKPEAFDKHLQTHSKERNLQCRFCEKKFIQRKHLVEHEKGHNLAKYGKMCRVEGCGQLCLDKSKQLNHERRCIRKRLEGGGMVDEEVLEDVRRRSQNVQLGWPGEEEELEGTEATGNNEEEGTVEGVGMEMEEGTAEFGNNLQDGDPLEGLDNFSSLNT